MSKILRLLFLLALSTSTLLNPPAARSWQSKIDTSLLEAASNDTVEFLLFLDEQADLSPAAQIPTKAEKGRFVYEQLSTLAERTQGPTLEALKALAQDDPTLEFRPYWVANMIWVSGGGTSLQALAQRPEISHIYGNPHVRMEMPAVEAPATADLLGPESIEANLTRVQAPDLWALGYTGQGVVIGGQDTGYDWQHSALKGKYRGWNGVSADHRYNWHDAIHSGITSCGVNSPFPCDDQYHGTHTMGTMVGDDGGTHQIGMAPGAKWIGCRNMAEGVGTPASYAECYQWFIAPTDLNDQNPRPDLAPDVINNSWSCPASEGCTQPNVLLSVVEAVRAAGIVTAHSAGNSGSSCSSISTPAAIYDASLTVGATDNNDNIVSFSSRGPVTVDGSGRLKPDVTAPGSNVVSSAPGDMYYTLSGTSMAAPHVAGLVALMISIDPSLAGDVDRIENVVRNSALPRTTNVICGGIPGTQVPNNTYGYGRIDALRAYDMLHPPTLSIQKTHPFILYSPGGPITYTLQVAQSRLFFPAAGIVVTDTLPVGTTFLSATQPYTLNGDIIRWDLPPLAAGATHTVQFSVQTPSSPSGPLINSDYGVRSPEAGFAGGDPVVLYTPGVLEIRFFPLINP